MQERPTITRLLFRVISSLRSETLVAHTQLEWNG